MTKVLQLIVLLLALTGCASGAVVFAPTPLPPELNPSQYEHPSGAFSLLLPGTWTLFEQQSSTFAAASFAPPNSDTPIVQITAVNLGAPIAADELGTLMLEYQMQYRPDLARYNEQSRESVGDGSWRITGNRLNAAGQAEAINTFIQRSGTQFAVIEVLLPRDAALRSQVQTMINTFVLAPQVDLPVASLAVLADAGTTQIEIINVSTWTTPDGVFYVTGEVTNHSNHSFSDLPVRAMLLNDDGSAAADAVTTVMGYTLEAGGFAPFGLRFGEGQPLTAQQYTVMLGNEEYTPTEQEIVTAPTLQWTDSTQFTADGDLFIIGTVTNTGSADVRASRAIATVFDERGRVIAAGYADLETTILRANAEADFTVLISDMGGTPANYVVNIQALPCTGQC